MKRIILSFFILGAMAFNIQAQAPAAFAYQAVITNGQGKVLADENVNVTVSISNNSGATVYQELFGRTTDNNGLLSTGR